MFQVLEDTSFILDDEEVLLRQITTKQEMDLCSKVKLVRSFRLSSMRFRRYFQVACHWQDV